MCFKVKKIVLDFFQIFFYVKISLKQNLTLVIRKKTKVFLIYSYFPLHACVKTYFDRGPQRSPSYAGERLI